ncbi:MAG: ABC transporter ATP-binding protein/permease [Desulfarculus sp.]|nr:ABC transporter ATP-binding protein/permease [Pseudomonadota bacterium]MBU4599185.1 ABC transporter ATP-binding protein/permease [Pseudomonadota bacterium]MBV1717644.1 ABC transporter ATP-binding protein/permease [Desulfarculus sp.]MBV1739762.1 ABC transporter ATP-binding protein/permease [Desulfarculus sp.]
MNPSEPTPPPSMKAGLAGLGVTRAVVAWLFFLTLVLALFEGMGLGMLLPVLAYVRTGGLPGGGASTQFVQEYLGWLGAWGKNWELAGLLVITLGVICLRYAVNYLRDVRLAHLRLSITRRLRNQVVRALVRADLGYLMSRRSGELQSSLTMETDRAGEAASSQIGIITSLALIVVYVLLLLLLSPLLTACTAPILTMVALVLRWQSKKSVALTTAVSEQNLRLGDQASEVLGGILRIKMRSQETQAEELLSSTADRIFHGMFNLERLRLAVEISMHPLMAAAGLLVILLAVMAAEVGLAVMAVFVFVLVRMAPQVTQFINLWSHRNACLASLRRVQALVDQASERRELSGGDRQEPAPLKGVEFRDVWFRYPGSLEGGYALEQIDCAIPARSLTAVVGRSGAGKSTLASLLSAYHLPTQGQILLDGHPLESYRLSALRQGMAFVDQEPFFFNDTIRENLNFGVVPPLTDTELEQALKDSGSWEFVSRLEQGLDTPVGERGSRLSQGQKQRLAIAHALVVKARVLILDEPTSALDKTSELIIAQTIRELASRLMVIVIAHRLQTVRWADQILLLEQGRLIAQGNHESLLADCPQYREFFGKSK